MEFVSRLNNVNVQGMAGLSTPLAHNVLRHVISHA